MFKAVKRYLKNLPNALFWGIIALFDGKCALAEMNMTDPVITETERLGRPCDRFDDKEEDWQARERYAAKLKKDFCKKCKERISDERYVKFKFNWVKYQITIDCTTCKKHGKGSKNEA